MKTGTVQLQSNQGPRGIFCTIVGKLAVHRPILSPVSSPYPHLEMERERLQKTWTISHIPTGHSIEREIPTKKEALKLASLLNNRFDWDFTNPSMFTDTSGNLNIESERVAPRNVPWTFVAHPNKKGKR
jgi:hypothetical protein